MTKERFNDGWSVGDFAPMNAIGKGPIPMEKAALPHDFLISRNRNPAVVEGRHKGFFPPVKYEYLKSFIPGPEYQDKRIFLEFEGVYMNARVFINDEYAGQCPYGYSNFYVPADPFLKIGEENCIRITGDSGADSRWYSGAGIYRNVHIISAGHLSFALNGVKIRTESIGKDYAVIEIKNTLESTESGASGVLVETEIIDGEGRLVIQGKTPVTLYSGETTVRQRMVIKNPRLWDTESPYLYTCKSSLFTADGEYPMDRDTNTFGIRLLQLDAEHGLRINGKSVKLRGTCIHHDNGVIGAAAFERAEERRAEMLKAAGFNALRSAHHPMSKAMLDVCDRLGLLVMDEAFDMWTLNKTAADYSRYFSEWWERDIEAMVSKDYNHPCVLLYSIGNEIFDVGTRSGTQWGRKLAEKIRSLDAGRFTINAINGYFLLHEKISKIRENGDWNSNSLNADSEKAMKLMVANMVSEATEESFSYVDVAGYNYMDDRYETDRERYPHRVICGSETYPQKIASNWKLVETMNHVIGDFTWTGWDYLGEVGLGKVSYNGEATNGEYPWITAWCGDIDITGFRRPASYFREIVWGFRKEPYIAVQKPEHYGEMPASLPWAWSDSSSSWTWPGYEGKPVKVEVYSPADETALFLDGQEIGRVPTGKVNGFKAELDLIYRPGKLEVVGFTGGKETGRYVLVNAGPEIGLDVTVDRDKLKLNCGDLAYITMSLVDKAGTVNTSAETKISVTVEGAGILQGLGSANPITEDNYRSGETHAFEGRALAVIRPMEAGKIQVGIEAEGCTRKTIAIQVG
jgi:beta-galactosidase